MLYFSALPAIAMKMSRVLILTASGGPFRTWRQSRDRPRHAGAGGRPSQLVDGRQDFGRFGDDDEQGARADRGALSVRPAVRADRHRRPSRNRSSIRWSNIVDGSMLAQLGSPDMRIPIAYALAWPERMETPAERASTLPTIARLDFEAPDERSLPGAATGAAGAGGRRRGADRRSTPPTKSRSTLPCAAHRLSRYRAVVEESLERRLAPAPRSIDDVMAIDRVTSARGQAR